MWVDPTLCLFLQQVYLFIVERLNYFMIFIDKYLN